MRRAGSARYRTRIDRLPIACRVRCGIGTELLRRTRDAIGTGRSLVLVSAPEVVTRYPQAGVKRLDLGFLAGQQG